MAAILDFLNTTPIFGAKAAPVVTFDQLRAAKQPGGETGPEAVAIRSVGLDRIAMPQQCPPAGAGNIARLDQFLTNSLGKANTISFEGLELMFEGHAGPAPALLEWRGRGLAEAHGGGGQCGSDAVGGTAEIKVKGAILSSNDVVRAIERDL